MSWRGWANGFVVRRYAIGGDKDEWAAAQAKVASRVGGEAAGGVSSLISIKNPASTKRKSSEDRKEKNAKAEKEHGKKSKKPKKH